MMGNSEELGRSVGSEGGLGMSGKDRPLLAGTGGSRSPDNPTVTLPPALAASAAPPPRQAQPTRHATAGVAGNSLAAPAHGPADPAHVAPRPPSRVAGGTPFPGSSLAVAPPTANPEPEAPSGVGKSAWDSFDGSSTPAHAISEALQPGVRINQYEIIKMIGEGGMGSVFLARDLRLGRRVAIKFLKVLQQHADGQVDKPGDVWRRRRCDRGRRRAGLHQPPRGVSDPR